MCTDIPNIVYDIFFLFFIITSCRYSNFREDTLSSIKKEITVEDPSNFFFL